MTHDMYAEINFFLIMGFLISIIWLIITLFLRKWRLRSLFVSFLLLMMSIMELSIMTCDHGYTCMILALSLFSIGVGLYIDEWRRKAKRIEIPKWYKYRKLFFIAAAMFMLLYIYCWPEEYQKYKYMIPPEYR